MKLVIVAAAGIGAALAATAPVNTAFAGKCKGYRPATTYRCDCFTVRPKGERPHLECYWVKK